MTKKIISRRIPVIGKSGLLAIIGCIVGVLMDRLLQSQANTNPWLATPLVEGFHLDNLIGLGIPLILLVLIRKGRAFFIGWFVGALAIELYEVVHGIGGYTVKAPF